MNNEPSLLRAVSQRPLFKKQRSNQEEVKPRRLRGGTKRDGTTKKVVSTVKTYLRRQNSARKWMEDTLHIKLPKRTSELCELMLHGTLFHDILVVAQHQTKITCVFDGEPVPAFLAGCEALGVEEKFLFQPSDVTVANHKSWSKVIYCIIVLGRVLDKLGFKPALQETDESRFTPEDQEIDSAKTEADIIEAKEEGGLGVAPRVIEEDEEEEEVEDEAASEVQKPTEVAPSRSPWSPTVNLLFNRRPAKSAEETEEGDVTEQEFDEEKPTETEEEINIGVDEEEVIAVVSTTEGNPAVEEEAEGDLFAEDVDSLQVKQKQVEEPSDSERDPSPYRAPTPTATPQRLQQSVEEENEEEEEREAVYYTSTPSKLAQAIYATSGRLYAKLRVTPKKMSTSESSVDIGVDEEEQVPQIGSDEVKETQETEENPEESEPEQEAPPSTEEMEVVETEEPATAEAEEVEVMEPPLSLSGAISSLGERILGTPGRIIRSVPSTPRPKLVEYSTDEDFSIDLDDEEIVLEKKVDEPKEEEEASLAEVGELVEGEEPENMVEGPQDVSDPISEPIETASEAAEVNLPAQDSFLSALRTPAKILSSVYRRVSLTPMKTDNDDSFEIDLGMDEEEEALSKEEPSKEVKEEEEARGEREIEQAQDNVLEFVPTEQDLPEAEIQEEEEEAEAQKVGEGPGFLSAIATSVAQTPSKLKSLFRRPADTEEKEEEVEMEEEEEEARRGEERNEEEEEIDIEIGEEDKNEKEREVEAEVREAEGETSQEAETPEEAVAAVEEEREGLKSSTGSVSETILSFVSETPTRVRRAASFLTSRLPAPTPVTTEPDTADEGEEEEEIVIAEKREKVEEETAEEEQVEQVQVVGETVPEELEKVEEAQHEVERMHVEEKEIEAGPSILSSFVDALAHTPRKIRKFVLRKPVATDSDKDVGVEEEEVKIPESEASVMPMEEVQEQEEPDQRPPQAQEETEGGQKPEEIREEVPEAAEESTPVTEKQVEETPGVLTSLASLVALTPKRISAAASRLHIRPVIPPYGHEEDETEDMEEVEEHIVENKQDKVEAEEKPETSGDEAIEAIAELQHIESEAERPVEPIPEEAAETTQEGLPEIIIQEGATEPNYNFILTLVQTPRKVSAAFKRVLSARPPTIANAEEDASIDDAMEEEVEPTITPTEEERVIVVERAFPIVVVEEEKPAEEPESTNVIVQQIPEEEVVEEQEAEGTRGRLPSLAAAFSFFPFSPTRTAESGGTEAAPERTEVEIAEAQEQPEPAPEVEPEQPAAEVRELAQVPIEAIEDGSETTESFTDLFGIPFRFLRKFTHLTPASPVAEQEQVEEELVQLQELVPEQLQEEVPTQEQPEQVEVQLEEQQEPAQEEQIEEEVGQEIEIEEKPTNGYGFNLLPLPSLLPAWWRRTPAYPSPTTSSSSESRESQTIAVETEAQAQEPTEEGQEVSTVETQEVLLPETTQVSVPDSFVVPEANAVLLTPKEVQEVLLPELTQASVPDSFVVPTASAAIPSAEAPEDDEVGEKPSSAPELVGEPEATGSNGMKRLREEVPGEQTYPNKKPKRNGNNKRERSPDAEEEEGSAPNKRQKTTASEVDIGAGVGLRTKTSTPMLTPPPAATTIETQPTQTQTQPTTTTIAAPPTAQKYLEKMDAAYRWHGRSGLDAEEKPPTAKETFALAAYIISGTLCVTFYFL